MPSELWKVNIGEEWPIYYVPNEGFRNEVDEELKDLSELKEEII